MPGVRNGGRLSKSQHGLLIISFLTATELELGLPCNLDHN